MERLPERIETERLVLRLWSADDAPELNRAVAASIEHLRPWMPWVAFEPLSEDDRRRLIADWDTAWADSGDAVYGIFDRDGRVVGGTGLHRRNADRSVLDIGYWIAADRIGRGYATEASRALVETAFTIAGISAVDIHHDRANRASRGVPERLGFRFLADNPDSVDAPGEEGIDCHWRVVRPRGDGVVIRPARTDDRPAIVDLVRAAFNGGGEEVDIVTRTWEIDDPRTDELVAVDGDEVVGHVLAAPADLDGHSILAIAPLAAAPARHHDGIGSALVRELIARALGAGWPLIALLGDPKYYSRFGFEPSGPFGIRYAAVGAESPHFQILRLPRYDESLRGDVTYCWERNYS
jgi:ribosomal-protein-serine acetyltransferase